jgi:hypothetical protein
MDIAGMIELDPDTVERLTEECRARAAAANEIRDMLSERFGSKTRIPVADVFFALDGYRSKYLAASEPDHWTYKG